MSQEIALSVLAGQGSGPAANVEARLLALVLNGVTSEHSRRSSRTLLLRFFAWVRSEANHTLGATPAFTKALVGEYRAALLDAGLSPATLNLRLAPVRRLAGRWPITISSIRLPQPQSNAYPGWLAAAPGWATG